MKFEYRLANTFDVLRLSILLKQVYIHTYGLEGVTDEFANFMTEQFSTENILKTIESKEADLFVATYKENLLGTLKLVYEQACPIDNIVAPEVDKLYVLSHFLGKGIGYHLMQFAEKILLEKGKQELWLAVYSKNDNAIDFYYRQNFKWIGDTFFQMEENQYLNKVMYKKLRDES